MKTSTVFLLILILAVRFDESMSQALSPWGRVGLAALGGAVVDRTFFRQPANNNNYYYSYPGYYYSNGKKK